MSGLPDPEPLRCSDQHASNARLPSSDPSHGNPSHGNPSHGDPSHGNPSHGNPSQSDPSHGDPSQSGDGLATGRRRFALQVVQRLSDAGYQALWAGGCVRDLLLDLAPIDYDVATSATPDQVRSLFGHRRTLAVGAAFGVIIVMGRNDQAGQVEVATFRNDATYSDGRHPDAVTYSSAIEDAQRRDFTINGMFYDPLVGDVIDYVGGRADLETGLIRAIGNADLRIKEDKLRMLRAIRFAARFGFAIDPATEAALSRHASQLSIVSGERMASEMQKTLQTHGKESALRNWASTGLLSVLLPQLAQRWPEVEHRACALLRAISSEHWIAALAAIVFPIVDRLPIASVCDDFKKRLKLSNDNLSQLHFALAHQSLLENASNLAWSDVQPCLADRRINVAMDLLSARVACGECDIAASQWLCEQLSRPREVLDPAPLIGGNDIQRAGLAPGPRFKSLIAAARAAQLDGLLIDRAQALRWLAEQLQ